MGQFSHVSQDGFVVILSVVYKAQGRPIGGFHLQADATPRGVLDVEGCNTWGLTSGKKPVVGPIIGV